ncbi:MAG: hypothetical protein RBS07_18630 [Lentimicrobium sp.]|jgi:diaminopimelate decarboxylase|nr:hypothetical protein [Lentimicrobium sp.]
MNLQFYKEVIKKILPDTPSPFFIFSSDAILRNLNFFKDSFNRYWTNHIISYSVKTNPLLGICKLLSNSNCWLEVTSPHEIIIAKKIGEKTNIVYNGIYKSLKDIELASSLNGILNIDGWKQIEDIVSISKKINPPVLGVRFTPRFQTKTQTWDKFGFEFNESTVDRILSNLSKGRDLSVSCLHCHLGTNINDSKIYYDSALFLTEIMKMFEKKGAKIDYFDFGGGFISTNDANKIDDYVKNISQGLRIGGARPDQTVIIEPGRSLVENSSVLITQVVDVKVQKDSEVDYAILDSGVNMIMGTDLVGQRNILPLNDYSLATNKYKLFGVLCAQSDVFADDISLPAIQAGDFCCILNTGAYDVSTSYPFSYLRPPIFIVDAAGNIEKLRKEESSEYVFTLEA